MCEVCNIENEYNVAGAMCCPCAVHVHIPYGPINAQYHMLALRRMQEIFIFILLISVTLLAQKSWIGHSPPFELIYVIFLGW